MPTLTHERLSELLEKERAADAALFSYRVIRDVAGSYRRAYADTPSEPFAKGYRQAVSDYEAQALKFAAALPPVAADPATTDQLPF